MDSGAVSFLASAAGGELLSELAQADDLADPGLVARLRARWPAEGIAAAALTQAELRRAARTKFDDDADQMLFTRAGLEQATHHAVARHRAQRLGAAAETIIDLGCGIGADTIAFVRAGLAATAVDIDPVTAAIADANVRALGLSATVSVGQAELVDRTIADLAFCDPARRSGARRVFDPDAYSPPWAFVEGLLRGRTAIKTAPGIDHRLVPAGVEAEWVSLDGQLREAVLWSSDLAGCERRATVLGADGAHVELMGTAAPAPAEVGAIGAFVYEPDDAVVRSHLVADFSRQIEGWLIDPHLAYVTADHLVATPLGRSYRVIEELPFRERSLRAALRERDIGAITIKKRGVAVTPEELRQRLKLTGSQPATIILTRTPSSAKVLLVEPIE